LFLSGDLAPESVKEVPRAEAGTTVEVSATIKLPMTPKQYTGYYRLATEDGKKFGPRFWVDVIVVADTESLPEKKIASVPIPEKKTPVPEKKATESVPVPESVPQAKAAELEKVIKVAPETKVESVSEKPVVSETLRQDSSSASDIPQLEDVQTDVKKPGLVENPKTEVVVEAKQEIKKKDEAPKKVAVQSPYATQLEILMGMGFKDAELNAYLLNNNEGNVQRVVEWIISHGVH
jgi:hypothetical protein